MSTFALNDVDFHVAGFDFSTSSNQLAVQTTVAELDVTTFQSGGSRVRIGGLRDATMNLAGYLTPDATVDLQGFSNLAPGSQVVSFSPNPAEGETTYLLTAKQFTYELFGTIGEAAPFSLSLMASDGIGAVRGQKALAKSVVTATGQAGAIVTDLSTDDEVADGQFLYAAVQIFSAGTTISIDLESDDDIGFADPVTQASLGPITTTGGFMFARVPGPIADTHYRLNVTAITGSFTVAGVIAIR